MDVDAAGGVHLRLGLGPDGPHHLLQGRHVGIGQYGGDYLARVGAAAARGVVRQGGVAHHLPNPAVSRRDRPSVVMAALAGDVAADDALDRFGQGLAAGADRLNLYSEGEVGEVLHFLISQVFVAFKRATFYVYTQSKTCAKAGPGNFPLRLATIHSCVQTLIITLSH